MRHTRSFRAETAICCSPRVARLRGSGGSSARANGAADWIKPSSFEREMLTRPLRRVPSGDSAQTYTVLALTQYASIVDCSRAAIAVNPSTVVGAADTPLRSPVASGGTDG